VDRTRLDGSQIFSWLLVGLALALLWAILQPFWGALLLAAVLAGVLSGRQQRLASQLGGRPGLAAGLLTLLVLLAIVLPFGWVIGVLAKELIQIIDTVRSSLEVRGFSELIQRLPGPLRALAERAVRAAGGGEGGQAWAQMVQSQSGRAAGAARAFLSATSHAVLEGVLMLIALYFLLLDGQRLVGWLERVAPLPPGRFRSFLAEFRSVSRAVVVSTISTGAVQALAALVGYLIAGVPYALFFTLVTFCMSLIPAVGAASVPLLLSLVLFFQGRNGWGIFLVVWGIVVVGLIDNVVKPLFIRGEVEMHGAVVFFGLLGGLAAFGPVGLIAGPLVVAFFIAISRASARTDAAAG